MIALFITSWIIGLVIMAIGTVMFWKESDREYQKILMYSWFMLILTGWILGIPIFLLMLYVVLLKSTKEIMGTHYKRRFRVWIQRLFGFQRDPKKPKNLSETEESVFSIFVRTLNEKDSQLYIDPQTGECYLANSTETLIMFLEAGNVKIINTIFGYDVTISPKLSHYLAHRFIKELHKRRMAFKETALSRVTQSLDVTLSKLKRKD